jgi:hypothetical protein
MNTITARDDTTIYYKDWLTHPKNKTAAVILSNLLSTRSAQ